MYLFGRWAAWLDVNDVMCVVAQCKCDNALPDVGSVECYDTLGVIQPNERRFDVKLGIYLYIYIYTFYSVALRDGWKELQLDEVWSYFSTMSLGNGQETESTQYEMIEDTFCVEGGLRSMFEKNVRSGFLSLYWGM